MRVTIRTAAGVSPAVSRPARRRLAVAMGRFDSVSARIWRDTPSALSISSIILLDHVRHGETVLIEDRGVPVAQLNPVAASMAGADQDRVARLVRQGILRPPIVTAPATVPEGAPPRPRRPVSLSRLVIDERRHGR